MPQALEEEIKGKFLICPEGHAVAYARWNYAKEVTGEKDADGVPMYEDGLYCISCDKPYGLSKLKEKK